MKNKWLLITISAIVATAIFISSIYVVVRVIPSYNPRNQQYSIWCTEDKAIAFVITKSGYGVGRMLIDGDVIPLRFGVDSAGIGIYAEKGVGDMSAYGPELGYWKCSFYNPKKFTAIVEKGTIFGEKAKLVFYRIYDVKHNKRIAEKFSLSDYRDKLESGYVENADKFLKGISDINDAATQAKELWLKKYGVNGYDPILDEISVYYDSETEFWYVEGYTMSNCISLHMMMRKDGKMLALW